MIERLKQIHDALAQTHPTGGDILIMADCIRLLEQIIEEAESNEGNDQ